MAVSFQSRAAFVLKQGGIIAHQTDTIFGLACLPYEKVLTRLSHIKKRPADKAFILLASSLQQISSYIADDHSAIETIARNTAKPTTWLVKPAKNISSQLIGPTHKVAVRLTEYPPVVELCQQVGAIASTSANISSYSACTHAYQARQMFGPNLDYVDPNQTPGTGQSSTIIDLSTGNIIRR